MNIVSIWRGWSKAMGLMGKTIDEQELSKERLLICAECPSAKPNSCLEFINGSAIQVEGMYCSECYCPCLQKSLTNDVCPLGKWDNIKLVTN